MREAGRISRPNKKKFQLRSGANTNKMKSKETDDELIFTTETEDK